MSTVHSQAKKIIQEIRHKINNQINKLQTDDENRARLLPLVDLDFHADVEQKIPKLLGYLEKRKCATDSNRNRSELKVKKLSRHYRKETNAPTVSVFKQLTNETERNLYANDFEIWVLYQLNVECISFRPDELRAWIFDYTFAVDNLYKGDELGTSRMILVYLKLIAALDKIACRTYPILKQHRTSINPNIINSLLLPQREDMAIAFELEQYFKKRNANATGPGLIEEKSVSVNSFSVKFAEQSADMQNVVTQIKRIEEHGIACKRQEWQCGRDEVQSLRNQDQRMVHTNYTNYRYGYTRHDKFCKKCAVEKKIRNMRIEMYERPLPTETYEENAVAFELRCPIQIACLRDVLFSFTTFCENPKGFEFASLVNAANRRGWVAYHQIYQFNISNSMFISLGGSNSSYKYKEHVDSSFECFVVKNGIGCTFYGSQSTLPSAISDECINTVCTLPVENEYKSLQWTLNGTHHTQNEVLSRQNECHERLTLSEFKNFGSLRADGHRLQLRKLYAMIETEALSLEQSSVLSLVIQTLWEAGIAGDDGAIRESDTDFNDSKFAAAMIELLDKFCEQQKKNWVHPNKLLIAALIAVRVFEMNDDETLADQIVNLLDKIRSIAFDWIEKITHAIKESTNSSLHSDKQLHMKLLSVSIAGAMTFFINYNHTFFEKIFVENKQTKYSAPRVWIQFIITMNNNILSNANQNEMPLNLRLLLRMVRNIGIHIEPTIRSMIEGCMPMPNDIYRLVKQLWSRVDCARSIQSYFYSDYPQTLVFEVLLKGFANYITIDIITGEFLVNNRPVVHSPTTITEAEIFQRTFGNFVFAVQPDSAYTFSTVQKYNNCNYEFQCENETLIIERRDGIEKEIVPPSVLANEIPHHLIENYSHFWNKQTNVIEFRPKLFSDKNFSNQDGIEYQLDLNERRLIHMKTQRLMLDITSGSYLKIATHLSRLEVPKFIHVLMDKPQVATVELIRMRLKFTVDASARRQIYDMVSNEFAGMRVGLAQKCGTLYGFHHGLLLESMPNENSITNASKKLLIIPHGEIQTERTNLHVSVKVKINGDLRNPPFHQYEIDEFCSQIKASSSNYSAWFFLAYLHAVTSHGEMEPFTKMSGTECALQILQSGFAWASAPYDEDATKMLDAIAKLSPNRKMKEFYQQVEWPSIIPPRSAQDTYILIAHRLLEDSQRLHELYFIPKMKTITTNILNKRQYLRSLPFIPNLRISETFAKYEKLQTSKASFSFETPSNGTRTISVLYHNQKYVVPKGLNLKGFLMSNDTLDGTANMENVKLLLHHQVYQKFVDLWIPLYEYARRGMFNKEQFALIWSVLSHENNSLDPILALQAIQMNPQAFCSIDPPPIEKYQIGEGMEYDVNVVRNILGSYHTRPFFLYYSMDSPERLAYDERIKQAIENMISSINWPCDGIKLHCDVSEINVAEASLAISQRLKIWNNNRKLALFIQQVQETLERLPASDPLTFNELKYVEFCSMDWQKYEIDYKMKMCERIDDFEEVIQEAQSIWAENSANLVKSVDFWWSVYENIVNGSNSQHLIDAGMYPRAVPSLVLPAITAKEDNPLKMVVGALAVTIVHEQRQKRIALYSQQDHLKGALTREMQNEPHVNWKPCEYPEWVLFEIEQNLMIRRIQVDVARQMMAPQKNCEKKHSVMQLNTGEGKTAVITPIVAAILANGKEACQITVLKPLFATNLKSLRRYLGGMLKRRLYIFPCRRNMKIEKHVSEMLKIYEECKQMKGIILTLPEYRLSFQLKIYESIQKSDYRAAANFLQVHKWIEANVRNILDESDAILHPKYQLVYTLGTQSSLEENRWLIAQAVLKRIPYHMKKLYIQFGPEKIEFDENYIKKGQIFGAPKVNHRDDVFTPCRILDGSVYEELKSLLIEDFLSGRINIAFQEMKPNTKNELRFLLREKSIDKNTFHQIMDVFLTEERDIIMILSGLLRFEILKLVLMKRWRVNYGVNEKGQRKTLREGGRKMAIPFKAKDVAAEQTEFGHPDVAICLTHLSYYYSGLNNDQLKETFNALSMCHNAPEIYNKWAESVSSSLIDVSIQTYSGVNLSDPQQRDEILYPTYRFNMHVIDFYLAKFVFPREAKTFKYKLMCSTWDLCSFALEHPLRGFSGTNDTKNILPMSVEQNDLPELESTNEEVRKTLLLPENQNYKALEANVSGRAIIGQLVDCEIPVLLDSGALMLELNNQQVAKEWLALAPDTFFDAAVFFDTNDVIQTIDRKEIVTEFDCSVYREKLNRCLVYLDDVHTRGTDLKFPLNWKACVTLSGDITRDKTVQACMRMRQLGKGQSIAFWASYEADLKIQKLCESKAKPHECTPNQHVVEFICNNSKTVETENTVHWAAGAHNYTKKLIGHLTCGNHNDRLSLDHLLRTVIDGEITKLEDMYGDKQEAPLADITRNKFNKLARDFSDFRNVITNLENSVQKKVEKQASNVKRFVQGLDEEQERELEKEMELEQECQIERPNRMSPVKPEFDKKLQHFISEGATTTILSDLLKRQCLISLGKSLENSQLIRNHVDETKAWSDYIFVTKDFTQVCTKCERYYGFHSSLWSADDYSLYHSQPSRAKDAYMRPIWWIARVEDRTSGKYYLILLSSFECDRLLSTFKKSKNAALFLYRPKLSKFHNDLLHQSKLQVSAMTTIPRIDIHDQVQIAMYSGAMYFNNKSEQNAYCNFLGLIPRPRPDEFEADIFESNGFVPPKNRSHSTAISNAVGKCKFNKNPADLAIKLIQAHHYALPEECHAFSILKQGFGDLNY